MTTFDDIDRRIGTILADVSGAEGLSTTTVEQALPSRQILSIERTTYIAAGFRPSLADPAPQSGAVIQVAGTPSPSSDVTNGYLRFVPASAIRTPSYDPTRLQIQLWLNEDYLPMVLEQLGHRSRYLWIGWFDGGHIYSDLHTSP